MKCIFTFLYFSLIFTNKGHAFSFKKSEFAFSTQKGAKSEFFFEVKNRLIISEACLNEKETEKQEKIIFTSSCEAAKARDLLKSDRAKKMRESKNDQTSLGEFLCTTFFKLKTESLYRLPRKGEVLFCLFPDNSKISVGSLAAFYMDHHSSSLEE